MFANTYSAQKLFSLFEAIYSGMSASDAESNGAGLSGSIHLARWVQFVIHFW